MKIYEVWLFEGPKANRQNRYFMTEGAAEDHIANSVKYLQRHAELLKSKHKIIAKVLSREVDGMDTYKFGSVADRENFIAWLKQEGLSFQTLDARGEELAYEWIKVETQGRDEEIATGAKILGAF